MKSGKCEWSAIGEAVKLYTEKKDEIPALCDFVQRWSGGDRSLFMDEFMSFVKTFIPAGKELPVEFWNMLTSLKVSEDDVCAHFVYALLKHQATVDDKKDKKQLVSKGDITLLEKPKKDKGRKEDMLAGDLLMRDARDFVKAHGGGKDHSKLVSQVDILIVRFVTNKTSVPKLQCLEDAGSFLVERLREVLSDPSIKDPFGTASHVCVPAASAGATPVSATPEVVKMGPDGKQLNRQKVALEQKNFMAGKCVESEGLYFLLLYNENNKMIPFFLVVLFHCYLKHRTDS